jgi:uncharacterized protein (TIGR02246 family)
MSAAVHDRQHARKVCARDPTEVHRFFAAAFNAHDLDALAALYEPEAVLVPAANQRVTGRSGIRETLAGFLAAFQTIELETRGVVQQDETALVYSEFRLRGTGEDGEPSTLEGRGTEVMRRQKSGAWLFAIDDPFSTA